MKIFFSGGGVIDQMAKEGSVAKDFRIDTAVEGLRFAGGLVRIARARVDGEDETRIGSVLILPISGMSLRAAAENRHYWWFRLRWAGWDLISLERSERIRRRLMGFTAELVGEALASTVIELGIAIDGGKDNLSMAAHSGFGNCGLLLDLESGGKSLFQTLFAEEHGLLVEVSRNNLDVVVDRLNEKTWALRHLW